jgi:chemotaxis protein histidine kinase CheA
MVYDLPKEFTSKFELLKQDYANKLPQMVAELSEAVNSFLQNPTEETVKKAYVVVHNLSGSSGIFGYNDIRKNSKNFEKLLKPFLEKKEMPTKENITFTREKFIEYSNFLNSYL